MVRHYYADNTRRRPRPLQYAVVGLLFSFIGLLLTLIFVNIKIFKFPRSFRNNIVGFMFFWVVIMTVITTILIINAEKVAKINVPKMNVKSRLIARLIRNRLKPMWVVKLLNIKKSIYGYPLPNIVAYVADDCNSGWIAIENSPLMDNLESDNILNDLSGLMVGRLLRRFGFVSSELSHDGTYYIFYFEDVATSQRLIVMNHDITPFISKNPNCLRLAKDLVWRVDGSTPHLTNIGHTRSGKSYFIGEYLLPLMRLQGWQIEFFSVKNDVYVDRYNGEYEPEKIIERLEHWVEVMKDRNAEIKKAGKSKYSEMPDMRNVALVIDEIGNLNASVSANRKLKTRWEAVIGKLTATGASAGIHIVALSQYGTREAFLPSTARANVSDAVIILGLAANTPTDRQYLMPGFEVPDREYGVGQGVARVVSAGKRWEKPHYFETPLFE